MKWWQTSSRNRYPVSKRNISRVPLVWRRPEGGALNSQVRRHPQSGIVVLRRTIQLFLYALFSSPPR